MALVPELIAHLDELLNPQAFDDLGPNGLQVPGGATVKRIVTGVSAQRALSERAVQAGADLVLVHHGLFWNFKPLGLDRRLAERLRPLLANEIGLAAYHLPLDAHPEVGNNALLATALGATDHEPFAEIGRAATFAEPLPASDLFARVAAVCGQRPLVFDAGPPTIRRLAIVSGGAASMLDDAIAGGFDAFLTGEPKEHVMADAREAKIHFIAAGHYATETFGVRALGDRLAQRFDLEHIWVDLPNPV